MDNDKKEADALAEVVSELARLRDEIFLKIHLASMEVRDAWEGLQPRLFEFERELERDSAAAYRVLREVAENLRDRLIELHDAIGRGPDERSSCA